MAPQSVLVPISNTPAKPTTLSMMLFLSKDPTGSPPELSSSLSSVALSDVSFLSAKLPDY